MSDDQILSFLEWLSENWTRTGPGEYISKADGGKVFAEVEYFASGELLDDYKTIKQIHHV